MQVRRLTLADLEIAKELLQELGYAMPLGELARRITCVLATENHFAAVADDGGRVCGLIHAYERAALEKPCEAVVQALIVNHRARKTGVGRSLLLAAEAWAHAKGLNRVVLQSRVDRDDARAFYEQLGYERAATAHLMIKRLVPS